MRCGALGCWASTMELSQPNLRGLVCLTPALALGERGRLGGCVALGRWASTVRLSQPNLRGLVCPHPGPLPGGEGVFG